MRKILVTGGAGYVGSNLIKHLIAIDKDTEITSIDNYFTGTTENHVESDRIKYLKGNTWDIFNLFEKNDFTTIFHFGEYSRIAQSFEDYNYAYKSIVLGTSEVLKFCQQNNSKLIYSASSSKFGNNGADENLSPYSFFKSKNVELIKNYKSWFGLNYEICYFYNVFGENHIRNGKYSTVVGVFERQFLEGKPLTVIGDGSQTRDFTHISDICNGIIKAYLSNQNGEYFLKYGVNYSILEIANRFGGEIQFLPERRGERKTSSYIGDTTEQDLKWEAQVNILDYIDDFIKKPR